mmetsp:Transcript_29308/g.88684  ORF Transcript_29308/g.88684 Transcript_29308/m.88684 type:complete len:218 (+) Transcript_29308:608-1261(+)
MTGSAASSGVVRSTRAASTSLPPTLRNAFSTGPFSRPVIDMSWVTTMSSTTTAASSLCGFPSPSNSSSDTVCNTFKASLMSLFVRLNAATANSSLMPMAVSCKTRSGSTYWPSLVLPNLRCFSRYCAAFSRCDVLARTEAAALSILPCALRSAATACTRLAPWLSKVATDSSSTRKAARKTRARCKSVAAPKSPRNRLAMPRRSQRRTEGMASGVIV